MEGLEPGKHERMNSYCRLIIWKCYTLPPRPLVISLTLCMTVRRERARYPSCFVFCSSHKTPDQVGAVCGLDSSLKSCDLL
jgi:hypothetical protein